MNDRDEAVAASYDDAYASQYASAYITPWAAKHRLNVAIIARLLDGLPGPEPSWLDLACGQAWHFSQFPGRARQLGVDLSPAQLKFARANAPGAELLCANVATVELPEGAFDLVTCFWAAYCYLGSVERIAAFVRRAVSWVAEGGALYFEVLLPQDLESFNRSRFAGRTGFAVKPVTPDYREWEYEDVGGLHRMTSPPLELFLDILAGEFQSVDSTHDGSFMVHVVATGRRRR